MTAASNGLRQAGSIATNGGDKVSAVKLDPLFAELLRGVEPADREPHSAWRWDKSWDGGYGCTKLMLGSAQANPAYAPAQITCQGSIWVHHQLVGRSTNEAFWSRPAEGLHELREEMLWAEDALRALIGAQAAQLNAPDLVYAGDAALEAMEREAHARGEAAQKGRILARFNAFKAVEQSGLCDEEIALFVFNELRKGTL